MERQWGVCSEAFLHHLLPGARWWHSVTPVHHPVFVSPAAQNQTIEYVHRRLHWVWRDVFSLPSHTCSRSTTAVICFWLFWFLPGHWISNENMTRRLECWLSAQAAVVHVHIIQTAGRAVQKKKKEKKGGTISRQFIKFQCKHPRITAKGQRFNTAASVSIQTWALSLKQEKMSPSPNTIWLRWWCVYGDSSSLWQKSLPLRTALSCTLMWWGCHADRKPERRAEIGPVLAPRLFWPVCLFKLAQLVTVVQRINLPASHFRAHLQRFWARAQLFVDGEKPTSQLPYVNLCVRVYLI